MPEPVPYLNNMTNKPIRRVIRRIRPSEHRVTMHLGTELLGTFKPVEISFPTVYCAPKDA